MTIASSTTMPIASTIANSGARLMLNPSAAIAAKAPMIVTGTVGGGTRMARHSRPPPILQEDENDDQNQNCGLDQGLINLRDRGSHELRRVIGCHIDKVRREALSEGVHLRLDSVGDRNGIGVG